MTDISWKEEKCPYCKGTLLNDLLPNTNTDLEGTSYKTHIVDVNYFKICINCRKEWVLNVSAKDTFGEKKFKEVAL